MSHFHSVALVKLKLRKHLENQLRKTQGLLSKIELQKQQLEDANNYKEVVETVSYAARALQIYHQRFDFQHLYELVADIKEYGEFLNEIYRAMTEEPADFGMDYEEDELRNQIKVFKEEQQLQQIDELPVC
ncbi:uncharacterized protein LOC122953133 [Acropora millepora]|uniref:uncharacterized protein LOC122953133 n=1 Tax=Acropora millepora TaxID=45264 RepID=UPI001CF292CC|nr:uncharacterized protein LOC122953133 [Acropora millepora]